ncbi:MAG: toprim domain-containing protein [Clostridia bacterium]|nr:toprim domain-containing protein [Clostridia bacterium]
MGRYTPEQIRSARTTNLHAYLLSAHPSMFRQEGQSLRMKDNSSISIKQGYSGFVDFSTGETGNPIDFLMKHLHYTFDHAVSSLLGGNAPPQSSAVMCDDSFAVKEIILPTPMPEKSQRMTDYLEHRGIPAWLTDRLFQQGLLYLEAGTNNLVFVNRKKDFCELRGTVPDKPFHQCRKTLPDRFWAFRSDSRKPERAMICESAIDAMSLFLLTLQSNKNSIPTLYCSIGGVYNQKAIDKIRAYLPVVIAVDNDAAGELCRTRNHNDPNIIPTRKDWNEDLCLLFSYRQ